MTLIQFKIVTPEKTVVEAEIAQVTLPVERGMVTLLPNHIPYIGALEPGEITVWIGEKKEETSLATSGGFVEFHDNQLLILADTAERAEEIDIERAEAARSQAEALKDERLHLDNEEYARTAAAIEKESARVRVARKHRSRIGGFHVG